MSVAGPVPISTTPLRRLRFRVMRPGFRVNRAGIRAGESGAGSPEASDFLDFEALEKVPSNDGGEGGIRTHGTLASSPVFKTGAFDHSATSPEDSRGRCGCMICQP